MGRVFGATAAVIGMDAGCAATVAAAVHAGGTAGAAAAVGPAAGRGDNAALTAAYLAGAAAVGAPNADCSMTTESK